MNTVSDMVERVAKIIDPDAFTARQSPFDGQWVVPLPSARESAINRARKVLEAFRTPDAAQVEAMREALEEARPIIAAMPISEMVGRIVGEDKVRTYEEARGIFVRSLSNIDAVLAQLHAEKQS